MYHPVGAVHITERSSNKCNLNSRCTPEAIKAEALELCRYKVWWPGGRPVASECGLAEGMPISDQTKRLFDPCEVAVIAPSCEAPQTVRAQSEEGSTGEEDNKNLYIGLGVAAVALVGVGAYFMLK